MSSAKTAGNGSFAYYNVFPEDPKKVLKRLTPTVALNNSPVLPFI